MAGAIRCFKKQKTKTTQLMTVFVYVANIIPTKEEYVTG